MLGFIAHLQNNGVSIDVYNDQLNTVKTAPFKLWPSTPHTGTINAHIMDGVLYVSGDANTQQLGFSSTAKMEKRGTGNMAGKLFERVNELCVQFARTQHADISYLVL